MSATSRARALLVGVALSCYVTIPATADTESMLRLFPAATVGDFDGDGNADAFVAPRVPASDGAVLHGTSDGGTRLVQEIPVLATAIPWASPDARVHAGDFDGDGRDDLLVQAPSAFGAPSAIVYADPTGRFTGTSFALASGYLGVEWSADLAAVAVGDFDGDGHADALVRSNSSSGTHAVMLSDALGAPAIGPQSWMDGFLGRTWNGRDVQVHTGDFNGDRRADLLLQVVAPTLLGAVAAETAYAVVLADAGGTFSAVSDSWGLDALGAEWSPLTHALRIADIDGDGIADIVLRSKTSGGMNYLALGTPRGRFERIAARWSGNATARDVYLHSQQGFGQTVDALQGLSFDAVAGAPSDESQSMFAMSSFSSGIPAVGALAGEAGVSGGAATYSIPIVVPPGRAGMQPAVALSYSSRSGDGELGMGWSLGVGSSITRCGQSANISGEMNLGVTLTSDDRLCLDGRRLMLVSGAYGASGAVYRAELEDYARVEQSGAGFSSASSKFLVRYNDGRIAYYGQAANSVFVAENATVPQAWLLSRIEDAATNSAIFTYDRSVAGEHHIANITWTGRGTNAGDRSVTFTWEDRGDPTTGWMAGGRSRQTKRLKQINTAVGASAVREYRMYYGADSTATGRTLLVGVEECAQLASSLYCLPQTTFEWQQAQPEFGLPAGIAANTSGVTTSDNKAARLKLKPAFNDIAAMAMVTAPDVPGFNEYKVQAGASFVGAGHREVWYQSNNGTSSLITMLQPTLDADPDVSAGFNVIEPGSQPWPGIDGGVWEYWPDPSDRFADMNNDGKMDIFSPLNNGMRAVVGTGSTTQWKSNPMSVAAEMDFKLADFTGDGKVDVLGLRDADGGSGIDRRVDLNKNTSTPLNRADGVAYSMAAAVQVYDPPEGTVPVGQSTAPGAARLIQVTDYDGDGRADVLFQALQNVFEPFTGVANRVLLNRSTPTAASFVVQSTPISDPADIALWTDFNGDGLQDLLHKDVNGNWSSAWKARINVGGAFAAPISMGLSGYKSHMVRTGDLDNDGRDELLVPQERVASMCIQDATFMDSEGQWVTDDLCGDRIHQFKPDHDKYDASLFIYAAFRVVEGANGTLTTQDTGIRFTAPGSGFTVGDADGDGLNDIVWAVSRSLQTSYYLAPGQMPYGFTQPCSTECSFTFPSYGVYVTIAQQSAPDLMTRVVDGLGREAKWTLAPLSDASLLLADGSKFYLETGTYNDDAHFNFTSTMYAVYEFKTTHFGDCTGIASCDAAWHTRRFGYRDAMYNNQGRGFRGFRAIVEEDPQRQLRTTTTFKQKFPFGGEVEQAETRLFSGALVSSATNSWESVTNAVTGRVMVRLSPTSQDGLPAGAVSTRKDALTGTTVATTTSIPGYDANSCATSGTETVVDQFGTRSSSFSATMNAASESTNLFCQVASRSQTSSSTTYARHGQLAYTPSSVTINADYTYNARRQVLTESVTPQGGGAGQQKLTTYGYENSAGQAAFGNLKTVTLAGGQGATAISPRTSTTNWTADGYFPASVANPLNQAVTTVTDARHGQPTQVTDPNGVDTWLTYDAFGRKLTAQVEDLPIQTLTYASCAGCDSATRARYTVTTTQSGQPTTVAYFDALNRVVQARTAAFAASSNVDVDTVFDALGRVRWSSEPHAAGVTNDGGTIQSFGSFTTFDALDRVATFADAKGLTKSSAYDGGIVTVTATGSGITQNATQETDSAGRLLTAIDHYGNKTHFRYDALGNPTKIVDAIGATVTATYNALSQKIALADPDLGNWTYAYDVIGQLKTQTDAKAQVSTFTYDLLGRMLTRSEPGVGGTCTTTWTYDTAQYGIGKPTSVVNSATCEAANHSQDFQYDAKGRVTNVREIIDAAQFDITTTYDSLGRVDTIAYPTISSGASGAPGAVQQVVATPEFSTNGSTTISWNPPVIGGAPTSYRVYRRIQGNNWNSYTTVNPPTTSKAYTNLQNGVHEFKVVACNASGCGPDSAIVTVEVSSGQLRVGGGKGGGGVTPQSLTSSYGGRFTVRQVYNANGCLSEVQDANGGGLIWRANSLTSYGLLSSETFGNNVTTSRTYAFDGAPFVTRIFSGLGGGDGVQELDYGWNSFGQLLSRTSTSSGHLPSSMAETFTYDLLNRLRTSTLAIDGSAGTTVLDVQYDPTGNITSKLDPSGTRSYTYPSPTAARPHAVTQAGTVSYGYDANGNMTSRSGSITGTFGWNAANLPTSLAGGGYQSSFTYGANRGRVKESSSYAGRVETTYFVGGLYERFSRTDQSGVQHRYRVFAYGKPVAQVTDFTANSFRQARYLHGDHLGSLDAITDENGAVTTRMSFDAHGSRRAAETAQGSAWLTPLKYASHTATIDALRTTTPRGFTDHEMLDNVGLIHMNGRVYDPALGRFLSVDPVFQFPEDTQSLNPYSYVRNSPLTAVDPSGLAEPAKTDKQVAGAASGQSGTGEQGSGGDPEKPAELDKVEVKGNKNEGIARELEEVPAGGATLHFNNGGSGASSTSQVGSIVNRANLLNSAGTPDSSDIGTPASAGTSPVVKATSSPDGAVGTNPVSSGDTSSGGTEMSPQERARAMRAAYLALSPEEQRALMNYFLDHYLELIAGSDKVDVPGATKGFAKRALTDSLLRALRRLPQSPALTAFRAIVGETIGRGWSAQGKLNGYRAAQYSFRQWRNGEFANEIPAKQFYREMTDGWGAWDINGNTQFSVDYYYWTTGQMSERPATCAINRTC